MWSILRFFTAGCFCFVFKAVGQSDERLTRRTGFIEGDIMIGALFAVHRQPQQRNAYTRQCGAVWEEYGIHRVEATFQAIDDINKNHNLLPGIKLGVEIRDSCWYTPVALEQSIEFIRDSIAFLDASDSDSKNASVKDSCGKRQNKNIVGVIGPGSSTVTIQVQSLLQLFSIPQIGYSATSKDLSDKTQYKYFLRVLPSDFYQAQMMVDIVRHYNWTYIAAVHTDGNYGSSGIFAFTQLATENGICVAVADKIESVAEDRAFDRVIKTLLKFPNAKIVACFCEGMTVKGLLRATRRLNVLGKYLFLGSDGWADRVDVVQGNEVEAVGGLSIRIQSPYVHNFDNYYFNLTPGNDRNPWFKEFWQERFNCSLSEHGGDPKFNRTCTGKENLRTNYRQDTKLGFVIKGVYTMAHGLHNMQQDLCKGQIGFCSDMQPINGSLLLRYLLNVSFTGLNGEIIQFDSNGDPPGRYDILNYQRINETLFGYVHVGTWNSGTLTINGTLQWNEEAGNLIPESVCSKPCGKGQVKNIQSGGVKCCWVCTPCKENEFLLDEYTCKACSQGWWPNDNLTACLRISVEYIQWDDTQAIVAMTLSCVGFIVTIFTMIVFIMHNNTTVVKASTRELSYIILAGILLSYGDTFPRVTKPSVFTCYLRRVLPGFSFAMIYGALVTKTNRIARILAGSKKKIITRKPRFMSAAAQVVITWILILIEVAIITGMLIFEPANSMLDYPSLNRVRLVCNTTPLGIIAPMGFDFFLIIMCTVYAVKTRNLPENFNEAKFIGFTMYTTCVIWLAFVPIYFGSDSKVITMCLCMSLGATVALVFLFFPKLYIILLKPEKNNRSAFTTAKNVRCHIGSQPGQLGRSSQDSLESPRPATGWRRAQEAYKLFDRRQQVNDKSDKALLDRMKVKRSASSTSAERHLPILQDDVQTSALSYFKRPDSIHGPEIDGLMVDMETNDQIFEYENSKRHLVGIIKQAYGGQSRDQMPELTEIDESTLNEMTQVKEYVLRKESACQTDDKLLQSLFPNLRKRSGRSSGSLGSHNSTRELSSVFNSPEPSPTSRSKKQTPSENVDELTSLLSSMDKRDDYIDVMHEEELYPKTQSDKAPLLSSPYEESNIQLYQPNDQTETDTSNTLLLDISCDTGQESEDTQISNSDISAAKANSKRALSQSDYMLLPNSLKRLKYSQYGSQDTPSASLETVTTSVETLYPHTLSLHSEIETDIVDKLATFSISENQKIPSTSQTSELPREPSQSVPETDSVQIQLPSSELLEEATAYREDPNAESLRKFQEFLQRQGIIMDITSMQTSDV